MADEQTRAAHFFLSTGGALPPVAHPEAALMSLIARGVFCSEKLAHHKCKQCGTGTLEDTRED